MATEIEIKARTLIWEDSESNFESQNHILKKGEEVVILNPLKRKIGDGSSVFNSLPFDTNHYQLKIDEAAVVTLYNLIPQTSFFYKRVTVGINDITFRLDSFKDSNRTFFQCDGRMHKIIVQNTLADTMDVELSLSSGETTDNSIIHDIGTVTIAGNSIAVIEFSWFKNSTDKKICFSRIELSNDITQDISFSSEYSSNTSGAYICYNEERRKYYLLNFNVTGSTMVVSVADYGYSSGTQPSNNVEHYCLIKNASSVTKTVVVQGVGSGKRFVSEGLTSISLAVNQSFEFSYVWLTRGSERICVVTKSNLLTDLVLT